MAKNVGELQGLHWFADKCTQASAQVPSQAAASQIQIGRSVNPWHGAESQPESLAEKYSRNT